MLFTFSLKYSLIALVSKRFATFIGLNRYTKVASPQQRLRARDFLCSAETATDGRAERPQNRIWSLISHA